MTNNTQQPLVSVLMTVFNSEQFIREAIDSLLQQTYENIEIIIVNDGSTDTTCEIIESYKDNRIVYKDNGKNIGIVKSRNLAIETAKGKYLATLDSDDISMPDRIREQVEFMEAHADFGMCGTYYHIIDGEGKTLTDVRFPDNDIDVKTHFIAGNCFCHSSVMVRSGITDAMFFSEAFPMAEDFELWYRISKKTKVRNIPSFLTKYRMHGSNISMNKKKAMYGYIKTISRQMFEDIGLTFTERELALHTELVGYNDKFFEDKTALKELSHWIVKLISQFKGKDNFNYTLLQKLIFEKWMVICFKSKSYDKLLLSSVTLTFKGQYLRNFTKKLLNRNMQNQT